MIGRSNTGGGASLNFTVVGGTTQPSNPKENMIWVNTDTDITSYIFSASSPADPVEGMVWIFTGIKSSVPINVLKKHCIMVYPIFAKQYVSSAWVDVEAKSYQSGAWVDWWDGELYAYGDTFDSIAGGWVENKTPNGVIAWNEENVYLGYTGSSDRYATIYTAKAIDMTSYSSLRVRVSQMSHSGNFFLRIGVLNSPYTGISSTEFESACVAMTTSDETVSSGSTQDIELELPTDYADRAALYVQVVVYVSEVYIGEIVLVR